MQNFCFKNVFCRLRVECAHAEVKNDIEGFKRVWAVGRAVCVCVQKRDIIPVFHDFCNQFLA